MIVASCRNFRRIRQGAGWHAHCCHRVRSDAMTQAMLKRKVLKRSALALALSLASSACASDETVAAEQALAKWRNKRPQQYTYVLQPTGFGNHGDAVRIKVEQERLLEAIEADGDQPEHRRFTMTDLLEQAVELSGESRFVAAYDAELGYVKSFFHASEPDEEPGGYGFDVLCLEKSLDEAACASTFQMQLAP
jgi:hypothetical protein